MEMFGHVPCGRKVYKNGMETNMSVHLMTNDYTVYRYTKQTEDTKTVEYFAHVNPDLFNTIDTVRIDSNGVLEIFFNLSFTPFEDGVMSFKSHEEYKAWYESMKNEEPTDGNIRFIRPWVVEWVGKTDTYVARYTKECYHKRLAILNEIVEALFEEVEI